MGVDHEPIEGDARATYDYRGGEATVPETLAPLAGLVDGDVRFDAYTKQLYRTDASIYEATPLAVVFPQHADDVARVVGHCWTEEVPVLPRGGGTSLAGQAVNEAVILDFTHHMDRLREVDASARRCTAEPGIVLGELNAELRSTGLKFAPDPAWADKSALGGAIGNNSTGAHSLEYGKTDAYLESCEVVLADGTRTTFGRCTPAEIAERADSEGDLEERIYAIVHRFLTEETDTIAAGYPDVHRNVSGYNLGRLVEEAETGEVNLARLLAGSEGTLAIVTAATIELEPVPETAGVALLVYDELLDALRDVPPILEHDPSAVEVIDDVLLSLALETEEFGGLVAELSAEAEALLLVEFYADDEADGRRQVAELLAERIGGRSPETADHRWPDAPRRAREAFEAHNPTDRARFWKLRKSGLPILLSRTGDEKHVAFIEDTAVPADNLAAYVADVQDVLDAHGTFASIYAHAGPGCLHIRPLVHTKSEAGVASMESIAEAVTDLVVEYGGSVSGEHGDGRARTQWVRKLYGEDVLELFRALKAAYDPRGLLNPGQVCGDVSMTENLRFGPSYSFESTVEPVLEWDNENGFQGMVELCHGCGGCRGAQETTGGVMCPTYRASREEITSTRGRANLLRQAMSGELPDEEVLDEEFLDEVLDLCIGCKGCARDCPSEVDLAKLKAEVTHAHHQRSGVDRRTHLFANVHRLAALGSATMPVSNWLLSLPGSDWLAERTMGIARERSLPRFHDETFLDWAADREPSVTAAEADREVVLLPDTMTTFHETAIANAAVRVLEAGGVAVTVPDSFSPTGRAAFSLGRLDLARERAAATITRLLPAIEAGADVVTLEPSDAVMLQSDYADLLDGPGVDDVATNTYGVMEYLDRMGVSLPVEEEGASVTYHGHCHQKATGRAGHAPAVLDRAGWSVDVLDSGCCGMAGSFGYEAEHYSMSKAIARILYRQVDASDGDVVVAPGASCRTQLTDHLGETPPHPIQLLAARLEENTS